MNLFQQLRKMMVSATAIHRNFQVPLQFKTSKYPGNPGEKVDISYTVKEYTFPFFRHHVSTVRSFYKCFPLLHFCCMVFLVKSKVWQFLLNLAVSPLLLLISIPLILCHSATFYNCTMTACISELVQIWHSTPFRETESPLSFL
jgi:hypothetical protein